MRTTTLELGDGAVKAVIDAGHACVPFLSSPVCACVCGFGVSKWGLVKKKKKRDDARSEEEKTRRRRRDDGDGSGRCVDRPCVCLCTRACECVLWLWDEGEKQEEGRGGGARQ